MVNKVSARENESYKTQKENKKIGLERDDYTNK